MTVDPHGITIAFHHGVDHAVSIEIGLVAQTCHIGGKADLGDTCIEAVGGVHAFFLDHQVVLGIVLNQLLHSTVDSTGKAAALFCIILVVGRVDQLQRHALCHGGIGYSKAV